jgi:hypothetical protein
VSAAIATTPAKTPQATSRLVPGGWLIRPVLGSIAATAYYTCAVRPWLLRWGATAEEASATLAGDNLVSHASYVTTRAVTINAAAEAVWPWLVQLGQGRAGFYTYDRLEQIVGAAIHSADRVIPELQRLSLGDTVPLSPVGGPKVALLDWGRALVLSQTMDLRTSQSVARFPVSQWTMDWTWSFVLRETRDGTTRLLVRTRAEYRPRYLLAPAMALLLEPIHFVMERGMLLGIKRRAEEPRVYRGVHLPARTRRVRSLPDA